MDLLAFEEDNEDFDLPTRHGDSMQLEDSTRLPATPAVRYAKPGRAVQACRKCRDLKMRCVVSPGSSTCNRCARLGRTCEFREDDRHKPHLLSRHRGVLNGRDGSFNSDGGNSGRRSQSQNRQSGSSATQVRLTYSSISTIASVPGSIAQEVVPPRCHSIDLLSIYSMSPVAAVVNNNVSYGPESSIDSESPEKARDRRRRLGYGEKDNRQQLSGLESPLSTDEISQLIHIFKERLLNFIPVFRKEDFETQSMYQRHPDLAHCICYVTSFFLPGGIAIGNGLRAHVMNFVLEKCTGAAGFQDCSLEDLHAMMILYAYSRPAPNIPAIHHPISSSLLKTMVEGCAVSIGLHRSVEGVKAAMKSGTQAVTSTLDFKKYTYWLWLYTLGHHSAVLNRTPPSIRADASIRNAEKLLASVDIPPRIFRVLGEVELCLLWEKASTLDCRLSEWWCVPETLETSDFSQLAALKLAEDELHGWYNKWTRFCVQGGYGQGLDFHYRYTRFCISSYALQFIRGRPGSLTREEIATIESCMHYALDILEWALCLSPVSKDALRYMTDFGFVLIAFAALFVTEVCQHVVYDASESALGRVDALSDLIVDLAISTSHFTAQLGRSLRRRVARSRESIGSKARTGGRPHVSTADRTLTPSQMQGAAAESGTTPVQFDRNVSVSEFPDVLLEWDPTAWWDDFLGDTGEWNIS